MSRPKKTNTPITMPDGDLNTRLAAIYSDITQQIVKQQHIHFSEMEGRQRLSSGCLVIDLLCGGGFLPCLVQISGAEQAGKSTALIQTLCSSIEARVPLNNVWDGEGTITSDYADNIFLKYKMEDLIRTKKINLFKRNITEDFFNLVSAQLQRLPSIIYHDEVKDWCFQIPKNNQFFSSLMKNLNLSPDTKLTDDTFYYCPGAPNTIQGVMFIDSFASLVTRAVDEQTKGANRSAIDASAFSDGLKRVMGRLTEKSYLIFGTNQLRQNPRPMYGSSGFYEPLGNSLKHNSGIRFRAASRSTPKNSVWQIDKQTYQAVEPSAFVEGAVDYYSFKLFNNTKNKFTTPFLRGWVRIWTRDHEGKGHGIDPAFDCHTYLSMTKQLYGNMKKFTVSIGPLQHITFNFYLFKCLVLSEVFQDKNLWQWVAAQTNLQKPFALRKYCFHQIQTGEAVKRFHTYGNLSEFEEIGMEEDIEEEVTELAQQEL